MLTKINNLLEKDPTGTLPQTTRFIGKAATLYLHASIWQHGIPPILSDRVVARSAVTYGVRNVSEGRQRVMDMLTPGNDKILLSSSTDIPGHEMTNDNRPQIPETVGTEHIDNQENLDLKPKTLD